MKCIGDCNKCTNKKCVFDNDINKYRSTHWSETKYVRKPYKNRPKDKE